ncbi:hypothetical protein [Haloferax volcanii]|uniref:hypothetical protein n=1 Tax=Haloferax volcanii TaxID=2246 RepID=UPI0021BD69A6|nr:hypothetical protein [Haloferax volcanii]
MAPTDESPRGGETRPRRNRRHRRRQRDDDETGVDAWLDATVYFGVGQHLLLALPMLWVAFMTVSTPVAVTTAAVVSLAVACLAIGALRLDAVSVGAPWHRIEDNEIGLGPDAGYGFLVRRAAYLNATLGLGTFLGARATSPERASSALSSSSAASRSVRCSRSPDCAPRRPQDTVRTLRARQG